MNDGGTDRVVGAGGTERDGWLLGGGGGGGAWMRLEGEGSL